MKDCRNVVPIGDDDDVIAIAGDDSPLLPLASVDAVCDRVERVRFGLFDRVKLVFTFVIVEPAEYALTKLKMYVRVKDDWKRRPMPRSAKIYKCASVALGRPPIKGDRIVNSLWLHKLFRCRLAAAETQNGHTYSVVQMIEERLA